MKVCAIAAAIALLASPAAVLGADRLFAEGACRDGIPHGAYQLRAANGKMRAVGAYNHGKRTGSFIFWNEAGVRVAHIPFDDDRISGTVALWFTGPVRDGATPRKLEAVYSAGRHSSVKRLWQADGRLRAEYTYVDGSLTEARAWSVKGAPLPASEAQAQAARDLRNEEAEYRALEDLLRRHPPNCQPVGRDLRT